MLHPKALSPSEAAASMEALRASIPWRQREIVMFGRPVKEPRLTSWHGEEGVEYTYSGMTLRPEPFGPVLEGLRATCERLAGARFNGALLNLYRDGADGMSWHADDEPELGPDPVIASVSLGAVRRFDLRHRGDGETLRTDLPSGSILVMSGATQARWKHQVPKTRRVREPRINVTFRAILE